MLLSICSGSINRLAALQKMVQSVRDTLPREFGYEFVIADNGSVDGTPEWIEAQADCRLIQLGKPVGGIRALTTAAHAATGKYVLIATDDTYFPPHVITRAIVHLEKTPSCGALAFQNTHNGKQRGRKFDVDYHIIGKPDGTFHHVPYPQIALVRKWIGDRADWWGANTVMKDGWTYAGDNHLGMQIALMGYSTCAINDVYNIEAQVDDAVRQGNKERHKQDALIWGAFYKYPNGVVRPDTPTIAQQDVEDMRILYINGYEDGVPHHRETKRGLREALARVGICQEYDYTLRPKAAAAELCEVAAALQPDLIIANLQDSERLNGAQIHAIRSHAPGAVAVNWMGDVYKHRHLDPAQVALWKAFDLFLTVNADMIQPLKVLGVNANYWQCAFEPVNEPLPTMPVFDVLFQGSSRASDNPYEKYAGQRVEMVKMLRALLGGGFGHYSNLASEKPQGNTYWLFDKGRALYRNAKIAISDNTFGAQGYTSQRLFEIIAAGGAMCFHQTTPNFDIYMNLKQGVHYIAWDDLKDLKDKVGYWLDPARDNERRAITQCAYSEALANHSFDARVDELLETLIPEAMKEYV